MTGPQQWSDPLEARVDYGDRPLEPADLGHDPLAAFQRWLDEALAVGGGAGRGYEEPSAMVLATATPEGRPSARVVLLRGVDARGFTWFSGYDSRKGEELAANPRAALVFHWPAVHRQVRAEGSVERVAPAESDAYFAGRPRGSQVATVASPQSRPVADRAALEAMVADSDARDPGLVPRPDRWGGSRLVPDVVEFWQGRRNRLHDRLLFTRSGPAAGAGETAWTVERLAP